VQGFSRMEGVRGRVGREAFAAVDVATRGLARECLHRRDRVTGLTAGIGIRDIGKPAAGETL